MAIPGQSIERAEILPPPAASRGLDQTAVAAAVLLRVTGAHGGGLPVSRLVHDLSPFAVQCLPADAMHRALDNALLKLAADDCLRLEAGRVKPMAAIWPRRDQLLGCRLPHQTGWVELRDVHLIARALDLASEPRRRRSLRDGSGLRRAVLEKAFGVRFKDIGGVADLRDALARLALRRGTVTGDAAVATGLLPPRQRRAQAASLLRDTARAPATDAQLVAALAAEQLGASGTSLAALRQELLRRYLSGERFGVAVPAAPPPPRRLFDLGEFLMEVRNFARQLAQGWQGNRRALISRVFPALCRAHPEWGLDVSKFKSLLADAHRAGSLNLVNADLRDRGILAELQASAVAYHNMIMHFIRVEDEASDAA